MRADAMTSERLEQLQCFVELRERFEQRMRERHPNLPGLQDFAEAARDLPIAELLEENRRLREACRAAANCDHTHTPDVLALLEEALKGE